MIKTFTILILLSSFVFANNNQTPLEKTIMGNWYSTTRSLNNGTETIEKEYLQLNKDDKFTLVLLVSVKKEDFFVRDLRIEVSGIWRAKHNTLVYIIKKINIPVAKEVYRISHQSLRNLANNFKYMYENNKIHINKITYLNGNEMTILNNKDNKTTYKR